LESGGESFKIGFTRTVKALQKRGVMKVEGCRPNLLPTRSAFAFLRFGVRLGAVAAPVVLTISQARKAATEIIRCGFSDVSQRV
jgi:hypothetical protein